MFCLFFVCRWLCSSTNEGSVIYITTLVKNSESLCKCVPVDIRIPSPHGLMTMTRYLNDQQ